MDKSIQAVEQKTVEFYEDEITAIRTQDGTVFVPLRPICDLLGVQWAAQRKRINRDDVLSKYVRTLSVSVTDTLRTRDRSMVCLPLKYISGFLFGINASRVDPSLKERLVIYQEECYEVLANAFASGRLTNHQAIMDADSPAARAYQIATALQDLARYQWMMEKRIDSAETQLTTHDNLLADYGDRIESLELQLISPDHIISDGQASQISQAVKAIALELGKRSGRNEYGGVYGELYRRFEITSYKNLHASKFDDALNWLTNWYQTITDSQEVPF